MSDDQRRRERRAVRISNNHPDLYTGILERIIRGEYPAGHRLVEEELVKTFAVSRTPVREVLLSLENHGLVERIPNRGARVADFTPDDVDEIYEIRVALECLALRTAINNIPASELVEFERLLQIGLDAEFDSARKVEYFGLDLELHRLIISNSQNRRLQIYLESIALLVHSLRVMSNDARVRRAAEEHLAITKALLDRDLETAEALLASHIRQSKKDALAMFLHPRVRAK